MQFKSLEQVRLCEWTKNENLQTSILAPQARKKEAGIRCLEMIRAKIKPQKFQEEVAGKQPKITYNIPLKKKKKSPEKTPFRLVS